MIRTLLYAMSKSTVLPRMIGESALAWRAASRFVAGERLDQVMTATRDLNASGMGAVLNYLGEHVTSREQAAAASDEYLQALRALHEARSNAYLSVKLSQLGLDVDAQLCRDQVDGILSEAKRLDLFVRIDMESSTYTDRTLQLYQDVRARFHNVGIVVQANLRRSEADLRQLVGSGADVRLVKGAYLEPAGVAFEAKREVDENYVRLLKLCWSAEAVAAGARVAVATHDERMIRLAIALSERAGIAPNAFQFEMLFGIRRDLQRRLVDEGRRVSVYVPYGEQWYAYLMRRLAERPANLLFVLRNLVHR